MDLSLNNPQIEDICNHNIKNMPSDNLYNAFNEFIFNSDIKVIGKLLHRFNFFNLTKHLAGDIVELGVFKGSGVATFIKFLEIFATHSNKKVIGFDLFNKNNTVVNNYENGITMKTVYSKVATHDELSYDVVKNKLQNINNDLSKFILVEGDVCKTTKDFTLDNPGFRISLLYVDLDLNDGKYGEENTNSQSAVRSLQMLTDYAKEHYINVICIGQVNKSGNMAGSQKLKHMVDAMLHLSIEKKDEDFKGLRVLETIKNRFGGAGWTFFMDLKGNGFNEVARIGAR